MIDCRQDRGVRALGSATCVSGQCTCTDSLVTRSVFLPDKSAVVMHFLCYTLAVPPCTVQQPECSAPLTLSLSLCLPALQRGISKLGHHQRQALKCTRSHGIHHTKHCLLTSAFGEMICAAMRLKNIKTLKSIMMTADVLMLWLIGLILVDLLV